MATLPACKWTVLEEKGHGSCLERLSDDAQSGDSRGMVAEKGTAPLSGCVDIHSRRVAFKEEHEKSMSPDSKIVKGILFDHQCVRKSKPGSCIT
jgi:hypothetical protein